MGSSGGDRHELFMRSTLSRFLVDGRTHSQETSDTSEAGDGKWCGDILPGADAGLFCKVRREYIVSPFFSTPFNEDFMRRQYQT